jgi:TPR repeat protein
MKSIFKVLLCVCALSVGGTGAAYAGQFEDAEIAYVLRDYATALELWRTLADQGHPLAQFRLGLMYRWGVGVPKDKAEALKWFRLAADAGISYAQNTVGFMYAEGDGVPKNDAKAAKWYRLAADQGEASAQYVLGGMYDNGEGVPKNAVQAYKWWNLAAAQGNDDAKKHRDLAAGAMTREQIAEAQKLSAEWKPKK